MSILDVFLRVHTGTMFAGKTEALIADLKRYIFAKKQPLLFKPILDDRYAVEEVVSHNGTKMMSIPIKSITEIFDYIDGSIDVIGIDEIQFFNIEETLEVVDKLLMMDIPVIVAGLDMDYKGRPFGAVPFLMAKAEDVIKYKAVCVDCGEDSTFEYRKDSNDSNLVKLGGSDEYESLCRACRKKRLIREDIRNPQIHSGEVTDINFKDKE
jgi:thymidine kinase